ncbi:MAG: YfbM family protein [Deltaproteobacteria bacterium]|nr:YfbM family protein [Deltaproteobacteria bacterium]
MGIWTWLARHDVTEDELADHARFEARYAAMTSEEPGHVEEIDTHRDWHALHVALTGCEQGGPSPAADVMGVHAGTHTEWGAIRWPDEVARIAEFLDEVQWPDALRTLARAFDQGVFYYNFYNVDGNEDRLTGTFEDVRRFFRDAARAGQVVTLRRL